MTKIILSEKEIIHLAKLVNLTLEEKEIKKFKKQLTQTLDYIQNLKELNTDNILPTHHTVNSNNIFFEDGQDNQRNLNTDQVFANTKIKKNVFFVVKRIL